MTIKRQVSQLIHVDKGDLFFNFNVFDFGQVSDRLDSQFLIFKGPRTTWYRPTTLEQLIRLKEKYPSAKLVNGNTEVGKLVLFVLDKVY